MQERIEVARRGVDEEGRYSNYFKVGFNSFEFVLDFGQSYESTTEERPHTRIVTGPVYAKALAQLLLDSLAAYEQTHGSIPEIARREPAAGESLDHTKDGDP